MCQAHPDSAVCWGLFLPIPHFWRMGSLITMAPISNQGVPRCIWMVKAHLCRTFVLNVDLLMQWAPDWTNGDVVGGFGALLFRCFFLIKFFLSWFRCSMVQAEFIWPVFIACKELVYVPVSSVPTHRIFPDFDFKRRYCIKVKQSPRLSRSKSVHMVLYDTPLIWRHLAIKIVELG